MPRADLTQFSSIFSVFTYFDEPYLRDVRNAEKRKSQTDLCCPYFIEIKPREIRLRRYARKLAGQRYG